MDGEPERLVYPTDSRGRLCGVHDAVRLVHYFCTLQGSSLSLLQTLQFAKNLFLCIVSLLEQRVISQCTGLTVTMSKFDSQTLAGSFSPYCVYLSFFAEYSVISTCSMRKKGHQLMICYSRDKPFLLFFDIKQCASVVSISELLAGDVDTNTIFTCPTQQVVYTSLVVAFSILKSA